jgi:hypothetical protein
VNRYGLTHGSQRVFSFIWTKVEESVLYNSTYKYVPTSVIVLIMYLNICTSLRDVPLNNSRVERHEEYLIAYLINPIDYECF